MFDSLGAGICLEQIINCSSKDKGGVKKGLFYSIEPYMSSNTWRSQSGTWDFRCAIWKQINRTTCFRRTTKDTKAKIEKHSNYDAVHAYQRKSCCVK